jgi:SPP1 gp7 family putative phage head morphogenesis protein
VQINEKIQSVKKAWFDGLIDPLAEQQRFVEEVLPILEETFIIFAKMQLEGWDLEIDPIDVTARAWIEEHALELAKGITETTTQALRRQLTEAWKTEGIEEIARRIREVMEQASRYRSFMIARTETTNAANMGSLSAAKRAGVAKKTWYCGLDERVCPSCSALHGMTIDIDEAFPGDILGPSKHPNCRCTLLYSFEEA